jgi:hypothetical protein
MKKTAIFDRCFKAAQFYQATGEHKQVKFRYNPENRTQFEFTAWKHEHDEDAMRSILVEDIRLSSNGDVYIMGKDNRYNLKQFASQYPQHHRSYRIDRMREA